VTTGRLAGWSLLFGALLAGCGPARPPAAPRPPERAIERVLPLAPDVTELVFAVGGGARVVAVPTAADHPPAVDGYPRVPHSDLEAILATRPDLVIATTAGNDPRLVSRLEALGVSVVTLDVRSFLDLEAGARRVGDLLGESERGAALAEAIRERRTAAAARVRPLPRRRALYVIWWDPLMVAAPGTFHDDLLLVAGLVNAAPGAAGRYPRVSPELLLSPDLEVVVAPDEPDLRAGYARVAGRPAGRRVTAGDVPVIWIPADAASRPGPRLIEALEALVEARLEQP
jgi:iron complex transport system substrate-binding protein